MGNSFGAALRGRNAWLSRKQILALCVAGAAALALALLPVGVARAATGTVKDFSITIAGGKHTFSEQRGKVMVYFFSFPG